jgi:hypothetical protein
LGLPRLYSKTRNRKNCKRSLGWKVEFKAPISKDLPGKYPVSYVGQKQILW